MSNLIYSKKFQIKYRIISEDDILRLAKLVHEQFQEGDYREEYEILFDDQSRITGNYSTEVFASDEFKRWRSQSIKFTYRSKDYTNKIDISLYNSVITSSWPSEVEVVSTSQEWYNSICNQLSTVIDEMEKQKIKITTTGKYIASMVLGILETLFLVYSLRTIFISTAQLTAFTGVFSGLLWGLNAYFLEQIEKAYPNIEFSFGPTYLNTSQKKRKCFGILIPFLIDVLFFVVGLVK